MKLNPGERICLANLHLATEQQVFDQVVTHLLTQNEKAQMAYVCRYRDEQGRACAAGCLISDKEYGDHLEGHSWSQLIDFENLPDINSVLIMELQLIHDGALPEEWHERLAALANHRGLSFNPPTTNETESETTT